MRLDDYTGENILTSMGLSLPSPSEVDCSKILIVFKPSFHPEVVIVVSSSMPPSAHISAFREMLWHQPRFVRLPVVVESHKITSMEYEAVDDAYSGALAVANSGSSSVCIDGMGIEAWRYTPSGHTHFNSHVSSNSAFNQLVSISVQKCWALASDPVLKNALADTAHYVGLEIPKQEVPKPPHRTNLFILGTPEMRGDYFRELDKYKQGSNQP